MKDIHRLLTMTLGIGTLVGGVMMGCGGETTGLSTGGMGASSAGGNSSSSSSGGNSGGSGGTGGCSTAADCSDGFDCTIDTCNAGVCENSVGPNSGATACPQGQMCQLQLGCVEIVICADDSQCLDKLGSDACKTNIHCDLAKSVCLYGPLDKDSDGKSPLVCGGTDCDDNNSQTYPGALEQCDGKDNNCNGTPDENATCSGMSTCQAGACTCPPDNACGVDCVDKMTSNTHCGTCGNACLGAATCTNGQCVCPAGATTCGGVCYDTKTDPLNCGGCGKTCATGYSCVNGFCTCVGTPCGSACFDTMNDPLHCGSCDIVCPGGLACQNGLCACPAGQISCGGQCVDTKTNMNHCGGCNKPCNGVCQNGACTQCTASNLYLFADLSGSMSTAAASGGTRFEAMRTGINTFLNNAQSANMGVGIGYHPINGTTGICFGTMTPCTTSSQCTGTFPLCDGLDTSCTAADYQTPGVGIAFLPGNQTAITNSLAGKMENGSSTPPPGYRGALQYAKNYAGAHSGQKVAVVFFLDSLPNTCNATTVAALTPIAQEFATGSPAVPTYVIGMGNEIQAATVNEIAVAGGTGTGWVADSPTAVTNALNAIRTQFKTCP